MQEKTIEKVLQKKYKSWLDSITDPAVKELAKSGTIITGGAIVSLMQNEKPNDYDLYCKNKETCIAVAQYYCKQFNKLHPDKINASVITASDFKEVDGEMVCTNPVIQKSLKGDPTEIDRIIRNTEDGRVKLFIRSSGVTGKTELPAEDSATVDAMLNTDKKVTPPEEEDTDLNKYIPVFLTGNAISLSGDVQLIIRFHGMPEDIHTNYDYTHTKAYWTSWEHSVHIPKEVYECVTNKILRYEGSLYPICSLFRMRKFIERGWKINAGQILKMSWQVSELDLSNINVLEDQLVGVDSAYFQHMIRIMHAMQRKNPDWKPDQAYVVELVNRIF